VLDTVREDRLGYEGWRVVGACGIGAFFATVPLTTFAVFLQPLADHFSWSREAVSSAFGTLTLLAAVSAPWLGGVLDRFGVRRVVVTCLAISGCCVASLSLLTPEPGHLRAVFAVIGLVTMGASPIAYSRAIFGWFTAHRGRALGAMLAGAALSGIALPPVAQAMISEWGWRTAWLVLGLSTLTIALPSALAFLSESPSRVDPGRALAAEVPVFQALRSRLFWTLVVVVFGERSRQTARSCTSWPCSPIAACPRIRPRSRRRRWQVRASSAESSRVGCWIASPPRACPLSCC